MMLSNRWRRRLKFWQLAVVMSAVAALIAIAVAMFFRSFYAHESRHFEPKDMPRGTYLERSGASQQERR
jgi:hypothetical protein